MCSRVNIFSLFLLRSDLKGAAWLWFLFHYQSFNNGTKKEKKEKKKQKSATEITMNAAAVAVWSQLNGFFSQKKDKDIFSRLKKMLFYPQLTLARVYLNSTAHLSWTPRWWHSLMSPLTAVESLRVLLTSTMGSVQERWCAFYILIEDLSNYPLSSFWKFCNWFHRGLCQTGELNECRALRNSIWLDRL